MTKENFMQYLVLLLLICSLKTLQYTLLKAKKDVITAID